MASPSPAPSKPPVGELGTVTGSSPWLTLLGARSGTAQTRIEAEHVPELQPPTMYAVYDQMLTDPKVRSLWDGITRPLARYRWSIDPNGADPAGVQALSEDLGIPVDGAPSDDVERPEGAKVTPAKLLQLGLLGARWGSMWGEMVGETDPVNGWFRLRKLGPRLPKSILKVELDPDGNPVAVIQRSSTVRMIGASGQPLPITRMVGWIFNQDPGNWFGQSLLRAAHKPWWYKQELLWVDAANHRRNGTGVAIFYAPPDASDEEIAAGLAAAQAINAGDNSGIAIPNGGDIRIKGVEGTIPDALPRIEYEDRQIGTVGLMEVASLGDTKSGSRGLGETFADRLTGGIDAIGCWITEPINDVIVRRWFEWNIGVGARRPIVKLERVESPQLVMADVALAIDRGLLTVTRDLEQQVRAEWHIQPLAEDVVAESERPRPKLSLVPDVTAASARRATRAHVHDHAHDGDAEPGVLRRAWQRVRGRHRPAGHAHAAKDRQPRSPIDLDQMHQLWEDAVASLVATWPDVRAKQIDQLVAQIEANADDLAALATLTADAVGETQIRAAMLAMAKAAADTLRDEAAAQGATIGKVAASSYRDVVKEEAGALATIMANRLTVAASEKAVALRRPGMTPADLATQVRDHLESLTDAFLEQKFGAAMTTAQNIGRFAAIKAGPEPTEVRALELLDANTCSACESIDDTLYETLEDAEADYGSGGYIDCEGGDRCRGTIEVVYDETPPSVEGQVESA